MVWGDAGCAHRPKLRDLDLDCQIGARPVRQIDTQNGARPLSGIRWSFPFAESSRLLALLCCSTADCTATTNA